jgi:hypothetical protein
MLALLPLLVLCSGCATGGTVTWVEGGVKPSHFKFKDTVPQRGKGPGGWRAACLHVGILRDTTQELFYCKFGVEVPIENEKQGLIPVDVAQSRAARCANEAAWTTLMTATPATPIGIACEEFKTLYGLILEGVIFGSRVTHTCSPGVRPVILTPRAPAPR